MEGWSFHHFHQISLVRPSRQNPWSIFDSPLRVEMGLWERLLGFCKAYVSPLSFLYASAAFKVLHAGTVCDIEGTSHYWGCLKTKVVFHTGQFTCQVPTHRIHRVALVAPGFSGATSWDVVPHLTGGNGLFEAQCTLLCCASLGSKPWHFPLCSWAAGLLRDAV